MDKEWSNEAVILLAGEYEKRPELWNKKNNMYRVQKAKHMAWRSLADMFSVEVTALRKKFNSILASYRRERAKVKEGGRSTWFLYSHLKFLQGYRSSPNHNQQTQETYEIEVLDEAFEMGSDRTQMSEDDDDDNQERAVVIKQEPEIHDTEEDYTQIVVSTARHGKKRLTRTLKRKPRRQSVQNTQELYNKVYVDSRILEIQRMLKTGSQKKKDDCDTYGEYIASTLRKHDKKTQCLIKQAINNVLYEHEMNKYENPLETEMVTELSEHSDE